MATMKTNSPLPDLTKLLRRIKTPAGFTRKLTVENRYDHPNPKIVEEGGKMKVLTFASDDVTIMINFDSWHPDAYMLGSGHVTFQTDKGERTFDRYGVEDSFYVDNPIRESEIWHPFVGTRVVWAGKLGTISEVPHYEGWGDERYLVDNGTRVDLDEGGEVILASSELDQLSHAPLHDRINHTIRRFIDEKIPEARERINGMVSIPGLPFNIVPKSKPEITAKLLRGESHHLMPSGFGTGYTLSIYQRDRWSKRASNQTAAFFGVDVLYIDTFDAD